MEICLTTICATPSFWSRPETDLPCRLPSFCLDFFKICDVLSLLAMWTWGPWCLTGWAAVLHLRCAQAGCFDSLRFATWAASLPPCRKGAFHLVLAGHTYNKLGFKRRQLHQTAGFQMCYHFLKTCFCLVTTCDHVLFFFPTMFE